MKRTGIGTTMIGVMTLGALAVVVLPASAVAQDDMPNYGEGDDVIPADEEAVCYPEGGEIDSVGGSYVEDIRVACWAALDDECKDAYIVNVGDFWGGRLDGTRYLYPDAYFDGGGECGWGTSAGSLDNDYNLYFYVNDQLLITGADQAAVGVTMQLWVTEYDGTSCQTGYETGWYTYDYIPCCGVSSSDNKQIAAYGVGDCYYPDRDGGLECHMLDVRRDFSSEGTGTQSYRYWISTKIWNGENCDDTPSSWYEDDGCFYVSWTE